MLTLVYVQEKDQLEKIYKDIAPDEAVSGANFVFLDDEKPVGFMRVKIDDGILVDAVKFAPQVEIGDKLFFIHAMFYKFGLGAPAEIKFRGEHKALALYGFTFKDGYTRAITTEINLHGYCNGKN
ncbi:MAG: hypothetical protein J6V37_00010 [Clostridia bacterium]|nr:hypothetical protein [Clostridia bacterium]